MNLQQTRFQRVWTSSSIAGDTTSLGIRYYSGLITLSNYGDKAADCKVVFRNGPESPRTRRVSLEPGKNAELSAKFSRKIIKLYLTVNCSPK